MMLFQRLDGCITHTAKLPTEAYDFCCFKESYWLYAMDKRVDCLVARFSRLLWYRLLHGHEYFSFLLYEITLLQNDHVALVV